MSKHNLLESGGRKEEGDDWHKWNRSNARCS